MDSLHFKKMVCGTCASPYWVHEDHYKLCMRTGKTWYCPIGHQQRFLDTDADRLEKQLAEMTTYRDNARAQLESVRSDLYVARHNRDHYAKSAAAYKGQATRLRNKYEPKKEDA